MIQVPESEIILTVTILPRSTSKPIGPDKDDALQSLAIESSPKPSGLPRSTSKLIDYTKVRRPANQKNTPQSAPLSLHIDPLPKPSLLKDKIKNTDYIRSLLQQSISNSSKCSGKSDERVKFLMKIPRGCEERERARKASSEDLRYFLSQQSKHHRQRDTRTNRPSAA